MKKIFCCALVVFFVSLIGFGVTYPFFGRYHYGSHTSYIVYGERTIFSGLYIDSNEWTVLDEFPYVNINSAGIKTVIGRTSSDRITISLDNPNQRKIQVMAVYEGDRLTIEAHPDNITFDLSDVKFGIVSWLEDIFGGGENAGVTLNIGFPENIYESINIKQGSGSMQVNDLYARYQDIQIGSGTFEFNRPSKGGFRSNSFNLDLGSGSATICGMETDCYDIKIGSGKFDLSNLCGEGEIDMGSGLGKIAFCDDGEHDVDREINIGSGTLSLYFPSACGMTLDTSIGSGSVNVNAFGITKKITSADDDDEIQLGDGEGDLDIDMGSGRVDILDLSEYSAPTIVNRFKDGTSVLSGIEYSSSVEAVIITDENGSIAGTLIEAPTFEFSSAPEVPQAPEAPEAPQAPEAPASPSVAAAA